MVDPPFRLHRALSVLASWLLFLIALPSVTTAQEAGTPGGDRRGDLETHAVLETNYGRLVFRFFESDAPKTSAQVQHLIREGFYDGKLFYRVVAGHVIQGGDGDGESTPPVPGEFGRPHLKGTVGLARDTDPDSGTSEIYICLAPRPHLNGKYAAFGELVEGMDVLDRIAAVPVNEEFLEGGVAFHRPKEPVIIKRAHLVEAPAKAPSPR